MLNKKGNPAESGGCSTSAWSAGSAISMSARRVSGSHLSATEVAATLANEEGRADDQGAGGECDSFGASTRRIKGWRFPRSAIIA